ncbi:MAG: hypothetical protein WA384_17160 [Rhodomicrobium sp.]
MTERDEDREYGNFTMNYLEASGRWRGVIKVPVRDPEGKVLSWVERRYEGFGPARADTGTEYISLYVKGSDPMNAARERRISVDLAENKPASYTARGVNRGTLFLPTEERLQKAEADSKTLPAAQGYVLIMIDEKPTYVEVGSWPRSRKAKSGKAAETNGNGAQDAAEDQPATIDFYSGPAEIHDPAVALARKLAKQMTGRGVASAEGVDITPAGFVDPSPDLNGDHVAEAGPEELAPGPSGTRRRRVRTEPAA